MPGRVVSLRNVGQHPIMLSNGGAILSGHHRFMVMADLTNAEERVLEQLDNSIAQAGEEPYLCYPDGYTITKEVVTPRYTKHYLRQPDGRVIDIADTGFIREKRRLWDAAHGEPSKPKK